MVSALTYSECTPVLQEAEKLGPKSVTLCTCAFYLRLCCLRGYGTFFFFFLKKQLCSEKHCWHSAPSAKMLFPLNAKRRDEENCLKLLTAKNIRYLCKRKYFLTNYNFVSQQHLLQWTSSSLMWCVFYGVVYPEWQLVFSEPQHTCDFSRSRTPPQSLLV